MKLAKIVYRNTKTMEICAFEKVEIVANTVFRFDLAVNGGGGVTLQFQRSPLKATTRTINLPWNQILVIDPVVMMPYAGTGISWDQEDTSLRVSWQIINT